MRVYLLKDFRHHKKGQEIDCIKDLADELTANGTGKIIQRLRARTGEYHFKQMPPSTEEEE